MFESDYNKWLDEKSNIENFDKLSEEVKKGIYDAEQELTDEARIIDLTSVTLSNDLGVKNLHFNWLGFEKECENLTKQWIEKDIIRVEDKYNIYKNGVYEHVLLISCEEMQKIISDYINPYVKWDNITVYKLDYSKWLDEKSKIENFDKLSEEVKKGIYKAEQELINNEQVNLYKIEYYPADDEYDESFGYHFCWLGYKKELEKSAEETDSTVEQVEDIVVIGGTEMMIEILQEYIPRGENDEIYI